MYWNNNLFIKKTPYDVLTALFPGEADWLLTQTKPERVSFLTKDNNTNLDTFKFRIRTKRLKIDTKDRLEETNERKQTFIDRGYTTEGFFNPHTFGRRVYIPDFVSSVEWKVKNEDSMTLLFDFIESEPYAKYIIGPRFLNRHFFNIKFGVTDNTFIKMSSYVLYALSKASEQQLMSEPTWQQVTNKRLFINKNGIATMLWKSV